MLSAHMAIMTPQPDDIDPHPRSRFVLPAKIFAPILLEGPAPRSRLDGPRAMLRHPGFWAIMLGLTVLMFVGALMLAERFRATGDQLVQNTSRVCYALPR